MPPPPDLSSYRLSDAESQRIFQEQILPAAFPASASSSSSPSPSHRLVPLAVLAVGQTGAGKTLLAPAILRALSSSPPPAHLIADTYKTYHPAYAQLPPAHASPATGPDARRWLALAVAEAARRRVDVVLESACRHPDDFCALAAAFRAAGYRVEAVVLAVPAALSRLGVLARFYGERAEARPRQGLPVRLTPVRVHDDSYAGLLRAARFLDESAVADQVVVVRRGNWVAYGWEKEEEEGQAPAVERALERERGRGLTEAERRLAMEDVRMLAAREDTREQLEQVRMLLEPLMEEEDGGAQDERYPLLQPLEFAQKDGDGRASNVLRLGYA